VIVCFYKKSFLKDLAKLPKHHRERVERLAFEDIPKLNNVFATLDIKRIKGYQGYYRIRIGEYRIGCKVGKKNEITFYRVVGQFEIPNT
jgi:mRNA interferase RelE/StbE